MIVFHYTDDYTRESGMDGGQQEPPTEVVAMIDAIGSREPEQGHRHSAEARTAYDALTDADEEALVTNYDKLTGRRGCLRQAGGRDGQEAG